MPIPSIETPMRFFIACALLTLLSACSTTQQATATKAVSTFQADVAKVQADLPLVEAAANAAAATLAPQDLSKLGDYESYANTIVTDAATIAPAIAPILTGTAK